MIEHAYSGKRSQAFWRRVGRLHRRNPTGHSVAYALGVVLQDVEARALFALEIAEREARQRHGERKIR